MRFSFPYYGQIYDRLYVNDDGTIALGHALDSFFSYALHYGGSTPMLLPLLLDLNPGGAGGDVFARQEAERLIITWQRVPGFYRREDVYTFQAVLYTTGVFEFSYNGLPVNLAYHLDDEPSASAWAIGAVPGTSPPTPLLRGEGSLAPPSLAGKGDGGLGPQHVDLSSLASGGAISGGPQGIVQDYHLDFRRHLHALLLPLAYLMFGAGLFVLVVFPSLFHLGLDGLEAQTLARALRPDLIVMDLQMPGCDGLEVTRRIKAEWPEARIVILTVSAAEEHLFAALQAGASGYLLKSLSADEFFLLLAQLDQGAPPIAPALAARIQSALGQAASQRGQLAALNPAETDVLRLVADGLTYRAVGRQLHLSEPAVKYHMKQILERLHLASRGQAEAYARRSGLGGDAVTG